MIQGNPQAEEFKLEKRTSWVNVEEDQLEPEDFKDKKAAEAYSKVKKQQKDDDIVF
jgi:hypothetical protein